MHGDYEISEQDFLDGQRLAIKSSSRRLVRWNRVVIPGFGLVLLAFLASVIVRQGFSIQLAPGMAIVSFFLLIPLLNKRTQKKLYARSNGLHGRLTLDVDEDGMQFGGPINSAKVAWAYFGKYFEDERVFVLYARNRVIFHIIPKRELSPEQVVELREYLQGNIAPEA